MYYFKEGEGIRGKYIMFEEEAQLLYDYLRESTVVEGAVPGATVLTVVKMEEFLRRQLALAKEEQENKP